MTIIKSVSGERPATGALGAAAVVGGPPGPAGSVGPAGAAGPQGIQGPTGAAGATGAAGPTGAQGPAGPTGAAGATGSTGPAGANGTSVVIKGSVATSSALPGSASNGDGYITADTGHLWVWGSGSFSDVGAVRGPVGPTGPTGPAGPGIATGGTTGQLLIKNSNTAYDTAWHSLASDDVTTALSFAPVNKAGDTMTGILIVPGIGVSGPSYPFSNITNTGAGTDAKNWQAYVNNFGSYVFQTINDAATVGSPAFYVSRTGNNPATMVVYPHLYAQGGLDVAGGPLNISPANGTGAYPQPFYNYNQYEAYTAGTNFYIANSMVSNRTGGTGHRETLHVEHNTSGTATGEFAVGATFIGRATGTSSGNIFGTNSVAVIESTGSSSAELAAAEFNVQVKNTSVVRKGGAQIVDQAGGVGSTYDFGLGIAKDASLGGVGFLHGIRFGFGAGSLGVRSTGTLLSAIAGTIANGIDLSALTITGNSIQAPNFSLTGSGYTMALSAASAGFEIGSTSSPGTPYIDFHSSGSVRDHDARIIASGGSSAADGQGTLSHLALNHVFANVANYSNDATASTSGVPVGGLYRNGSALQIRVS